MWHHSVHNFNANQPCESTECYVYLGLQVVWMVWLCYLICNLWSKIMSFNSAAAVLRFRFWFSWISLTLSCYITITNHISFHLLNNDAKMIIRLRTPKGTFRVEIDKDGKMHQNNTISVLKLIHIVLANTVLLLFLLFSYNWWSPNTNCIPIFHSNFTTIIITKTCNMVECNTTTRRIW